MTRVGQSKAWPQLMSELQKMALQRHTIYINKICAVFVVSLVCCVVTVGNVWERYGVACKGHAFR